MAITHKGEHTASYQLFSGTGRNQEICYSPKPLQLQYHSVYSPQHLIANLGSRAEEEVATNPLLTSYVTLTDQRNLVHRGSI